MPDPNRPALRVTGALAGFGRTPLRRFASLLVFALVAFLAGRWTGGDGETRAARVAREMPAGVNGTPLVIDGDTLDFDGLRVRIFGIDAFERDQLCERADGTRYGCGYLARESMMNAVKNATVACTRRDIDAYGRMVAVCRTDDGNLAVRLVQEGYALAYRHYSNDYVAVEEEARRSQRGAWNGSFVAPWDYRRKGTEGQSR